MFYLAKLWSLTLSIRLSISGEKLIYFIFGCSVPQGQKSWMYNTILNFWYFRSHLYFSYKRQSRQSYGHPDYSKSYILALLFSKHWYFGANAFYKLICPYVCVCVCVCVSACVFTFEVPINFFLPQLPKVGCPNFFAILNPWGKVKERSGLRFENFY